ncbi:MAG: phospho-N-acetylmuramoyl-pentapeptide-transferase [Bacilli bacterium]|jgi:phospho-N-acetylmuramoyl-pentapeptide-transferase
MLMMAKSVFAMMIGFMLSTGLGLFLIPVLKRMRIGQRISIYVGESHKKKEGTPTMGGLIFIIPTLITTLLLVLFDKIEISDNLVIIILVMMGYAILGFLDDYLSLKRADNEGLTTMQKLFGQVIIALVFFYILMRGGAEPIVWIHTLGIKVNLGWFYGIFILLVLVGMSNAVNITDGLDGLTGGLSVISFLTFGLICWGADWIMSHDAMAIFCFILAGSILGFLVYNTHPAKVFMGDTGALCLGATLAAVAILARYEVTLFIVGGVFMIETLSDIIQYISIRLRGRKVFLMTPLHHHFEKLGWSEQDIVKLFWIIGLILAMCSLTFGIWI